MLTTVKLPRELYAALENAARTQGLTKSEVVRAALRSELARLARRRRPTPYDLGKDLFGKARSGRGDLSVLRARELLTSSAKPKRRRG
jgi:RHH-type rel operon transcriptional repressor/antitoxin RelB